MYRHLKCKIKTLLRLDAIEVMDKRLDDIYKMLAAQNNSYFPAYRRETDLKRIEALRDRYAGQRCFIIGTGPSLVKQDLSLLKNEYTFSANKGLSFEELGLDKPSAYVISDPKAHNDYGHLVQAGVYEDLFLNSAILDVSEVWQKQAVFFDVVKAPRMYDGFFQDDLAKGVFEAHTVVSHIIQIACYMGFTKIYLIGVDMDFTGPELHYRPSSKREIKFASERGVANRDKMIEGLQYAHHFLKARGVELCNATAGGTLEEIPRVDFKSLF